MEIVHDKKYFSTVIPRYQSQKLPNQYTMFKISPSKYSLIVGQKIIFMALVVKNLINSLARGGYLVVGPSEGIYDMLDPLVKRATYLYQKT